MIFEFPNFRFIVKAKYGRVGAFAFRLRSQSVIRILFSLHERRQIKIIFFCKN